MGPLVPAGGIDSNAALAAPGAIPAGNPFEVWVAGFVAPLVANPVPLNTALNALLPTIGAWSRTDAVAASLLQRGIDELTAPPLPIAVNARGALADLPREDWWKLFIDVAQHGNGPMAFDYDVSPGYYHAMMAAYDLVLNPLGAHYNAGGAMNVWYDQMHQDVVAGVLHEVGGVWQLVGNVVSGAGGGYTRYGMGHWPDAATLQEMRQEGLLEDVGSPVASICRYAPGENLVRTAYVAGNVPGLVNAAFALYAAQVAPAAAAAASLRQVADTYLALAGHAQTTTAEIAAMGPAGDPIAIQIAGKATRKARDRASELYVRAQHQAVRHIAKLIRSLHVGHYYTDANGRLNTMLLLNCLLIGANLGPAMVEDTSLFGGSASIARLAEVIVQGLENFQSIVPRA